MSVFRKSALEKLSSPEQLDKLIKMTSPRSWTVLAFFVLIIIATLIWSVVGSIPKNIQAQGIIISSGGTKSIYSAVEGEISDVTIEKNDYVQVGDTIARVSQSASADELEKTDEEMKLIEGITLNSQSDKTQISENAASLYDIIDQIADINKQIADIKNSSATSTAQKKYKEQLDMNQKELDAAIKNLERKEALYNSGAISRIEYEQAVSDKDAAQSNLKITQLSFASDLNNLEDRKTTLEESFKTTKASKLDSLNKRMDDLKKQLHDSDIVNTVEGQVISVNVMKGNYVQKGVEIAKILSMGKDVNETGVIFYVPIEQGKMLTPGMKINVYPTTVSRQEYGHMIAVITNVSVYAASSEDMRKKLGNDDLVNRFLNSGVPVEVDAYLIKDGSTESGYYWSSKKGKGVKILEGTLCDSSITIELNKPITLVIPLLKEKISPFE